MFQFRSLQARIVVFFVILLIVVQGVAFALISTAGETIAKNGIAQDLLVGERVFRRLIDQSNQRLSEAARLLATDFGFRAAIATHDLGTISSVLQNHGARINASAVWLFDLDRKLIADTLPSEKQVTASPFPGLFETAQHDGNASAIVLIDGAPYQIVLVPVLAPVPIAWIAMGFVIDDKLTHELQLVTGLQVSFLSQKADGHWSINASTLGAGLRSALTNIPLLDPGARAVRTVVLEGEDYQTLVPVLSERTDGRVVAVLQRSLSQGLEPFNRLHRTLLVLALISVVVSALGSVLVARGITRPLDRLAGIARRIRDGDYTQQALVQAHDEIGDLAGSFNHMLESIATREAEILRLAYRDPLTDLPNRAMFNDRLQQALRTAQRKGDSVSVLLMDLNRFKHINDSLGHPAGDEVLKEVSARLRTLLRESDTVARLGGDEFGILLPTGAGERVNHVAQKILRVLEPPILLNGQPIDVEASIGAANFPEHDEDPAMLLRHADVAMYVAKRGNTGYARYDERHEQGRQSHLSLLGELRRAVESDELSLHYQPKANVRSGEVHRAEALVRWVHPQRGMVSPAEFIPFAEQTGYIKHLTRWVLDKGLLQVGAWHRDGIDLAVSINVSTRDLISSDLTELVQNLLTRYGVPPELACIEITESGVMEDPTRALDTLMRLHHLGIRLSIDDFGTGYSSLAYLKKLPVQELKIDRSFVMHMVDDADDETIVRSTIELGHNMGLEMVAEGVEDQAGLDLLARLGCDEVQGYFISKPLPAAQFVDWLSGRRRRVAAVPG